MDLKLYLRQQREWSLRTFGPGPRTVGLTKHIEKECGEIRESPRDLEEWADVMILALDGFWRAGGGEDDLPYYLLRKQCKNFARKWPPHLPEDQPVEHVKAAPGLEKI